MHKYEAVYNSSFHNICLINLLNLLQIIYNCLGNVIYWVLVHDGSTLEVDFILENGQDLMVLHTDDGAVAAMTVKSIMVYIKR